MLEIGIDIEDVSRFRETPYEQNKIFYTKIFSKNEIKYCLNKSDPYPHFTARYCVKEAVIKASKQKKLKLIEIETIKINKKPILSLPFAVQARISISHTKHYATAFVIIFD
tara:strand:+ start:8255 stop:8587 length:333 start_codon:yes stop_codon:yes gene_type:complete